MVLVATSAVIAPGLGLLGAYGVMSDAVVQRKREIALRLALGAQSWKIVAGVLHDGARIAAAAAVSALGPVGRSADADTRRMISARRS